ncbi:MAG TPA: hypothetical protein VM914_07230 [Pyrinomonadaceae bacterium]|jgi:hypothetical protein|nr:hypothetical protein [Pyrinomonadaceae bacterium]
MRHRSHIAFILLAAALFAAPQMAQDLSALKGAVAARIRGEIMQAFLGLHSDESAAPARRRSPRVDASLLACGESAKPEAQPAQSKAAGRSTPSRRVEARLQAAMLTDPSDKTNGLPPSAVADELASLPRQVLTETRLAMLTPPGNGVEPPPAARAFLFESRDARTKSAPLTRDNIKELERHAAFLQVRFERGADAESIRRAAEDAARVAVEGAKSKSRVQKVRRPARACGGDNKAPCALAPVALPVASLVWPSAPAQISDGE